MFLGRRGLKQSGRDARNIYSEPGPRYCCTGPLYCCTGPRY